MARGATAPHGAESALAKSQFPVHDWDMKTVIFPALLVLAALIPGRAAEPVAAAEAVKKSVWNGYERLDFHVDGRAGFVVVPKSL